MTNITKNNEKHSVRKGKLCCWLHQWENVNCLESFKTLVTFDSIKRGVWVFVKTVYTSPFELFCKGQCDTKNMKTFKIEFIAIFTMHFIAFTISEHLKIFRVKANGNNGWKNSTDTFKLPSSLCDGDRTDSMSCARFGANVKSENGQMCLCSCPNENATLMYNNGEWRCLKNSRVRGLLGE